VIQILSLISLNIAAFSHSLSPLLKKKDSHKSEAFENNFIFGCFASAQTINFFVE